MKRNFIRLSALLLSLLVGQMAFAMDNNMGPMQKHHEEMMKLFDNLDLSQEQKDKIKIIKDKMTAEMKADIEKVMPLRKKMMEIVFSDTLDQDKLDSVIEDITDVKSDMMSNRAINCNEMYNVLTQEQKTKFKSMMSLLSDKVKQ